MTGITAGDSTSELMPPAQRIRPESVPESPEVHIGDMWPEAQVKARHVRIRPPKDTRRPQVGLTLTIVFSLVAVFFSWVSAEPFWLAVGHGDTGTLTVSQCRGGSLTTQCEGQFQSADITASNVILTGASDSAARAGDQLKAQMVSESSRSAYIGDNAGLHIRWMTGFALILLCGLGIMWGTGSLRLHESNRLSSVALSFGIPVALLFGVLAFTW